MEVSTTSMPFLYALYQTYLSDFRNGIFRNWKVGWMHDGDIAIGPSFGWNCLQIPEVFLQWVLDVFIPEETWLKSHWHLDKTELNWNQQANKSPLRGFGAKKSSLQTIYGRMVHASWW